MGQVLTADNLPDLVIASTTTVTMGTTYLGKNTRITIGGNQYLYSSLITLNFGTTGINGLDTGAIAANTLYYIYAVQSSGTPGLVASLAAPATGPTGFSVWKEVGRCRTLSSAATLAAITNRIGGASSMSLGGSDFVSFTPLWQGASGDPVIGNGTLSGRIKRLVSSAEMQITIVTGTSTTYGSSTHYINWTALPITPNLSAMAGGSSARLGGGSTFLTGSLLEEGISANYSIPTRCTFSRVNGAAVSDIGSGNWTAATASQQLRVTITFPVNEWAGLYT